jgi:hypothetical protein
MFTLPKGALRLSGSGFMVLLVSQAISLLSCPQVAGQTSHLAASKMPTAPLWPYPDSLDALVAAPAFHRVLFENERVRVLEVTVPPHTREPLHTHRWPSVMYRELSCPLRYFDASGKVLHESPKPYQQGATNARARWQEPEAPHAVENMGDVTDRFIRVEYKQ